MQRWSSFSLDMNAEYRGSDGRKCKVMRKACVKSYYIPKLLQGRSDFAVYMTCEAFEHQPIFALNPGEQKLACIVT